MNKKEFSKKLLFADYIIAIALIIGFFICVSINGMYSRHIIETIISSGIDISYTTIPQILPLDGFGILLGIWIAQLGISSMAYYRMSRSDHKIQLPVKLIEGLPEEIKESVDMTQVITTVLNVSDN